MPKKYVWNWINPQDESESIFLEFTKEQAFNLVGLINEDDLDIAINELVKEVDEKQGQLKGIDLMTIKKALHRNLGYNSGINVFEKPRRDLVEYLIYSACLLVSDMIALGDYELEENKHLVKDS